MCILFFKLDAANSPNPYRLIIASNRDEFLSRPAKEVSQWTWKTSKVVSGIDLGHVLIKSPFNEDIESSPSHKDDQKDVAESVTPAHQIHIPGTWLGVTSEGRFGFITNFRQDPTSLDPNAVSRGQLVSEFLVSPDLSPLDYMTNLSKTCHVYNGFNLIVGDALKGQMYYLSNQDEARLPIKLDLDSLYGISNGTLITSQSWPKVQHGLSLVKSILDRESLPEIQLIDSLLKVMG
jgi:uncharacterized protein with NRDE domain